MVSALTKDDRDAIKVAALWITSVVSARQDQTPKVHEMATKLHNIAEYADEAE